MLCLVAPTIHNVHGAACWVLGTPGDLWASPLFSFWEGEMAFVFSLSFVPLKRKINFSTGPVLFLRQVGMPDPVQAEFSSCSRGGPGSTPEAAAGPSQLPGGLQPVPRGSCSVGQLSASLPGSPGSQNV